MSVLLPYGPVEIQKIESALLAHEFDFQIPGKLMEFWYRTGGGDFFETETFFYPLPDDNYENIFSFIADLWQKGMPEKYMCFYTGLFGYGVIHK